MHWGLNYCQNNRTMNTLNIFGMFIVYCQSQWRSGRASKPKLPLPAVYFSHAWLITLIAHKKHSWNVSGVPILWDTQRPLLQITNYWYIFPSCVILHNVAACINYITVKVWIQLFILLHEKFLKFDWLRAVVFQLNLKYLHVKITNLLQVVV